MSRTVWVTGVSGGLGRAVAQAFTERGDVVVGLDLNPPTDPSFRFLNCDLSNRAQIRSCLAQESAPEVVVHCAGITRDRVFWKMDDCDWDDVIAVNLTSAASVAAVAVNAMKPLERGSLIFISSINAQRGKFGQTNYVVSKAGLEALTRNLALELGRYGIRVNAVAPGLVETPMTKYLPAESIERARSERLLPSAPTPEDIAAVVLFLASAEARCITGHVLPVDSGQRMGRG